MKRQLLLLLLTLYSVISFGQGTVRGKITDMNGETIIGATIMMKSNMSFGTITDLDGNYSLKISDTVPQALIISAIGLQKIEETVHPRNGEVIVKNIALTSTSQAVKEVQITAKAVRAQEYYVEKIKQNSATTLDYVSSETMKKTGDVNVSAAVARVTGISTTSNGFFTVRGIGDRYVKTGINGSRIPTLDPFTNNIKLDLFPASLVDNVIITKTASPELPGDWAGAYLSIETRDYPERFTVNAEVSLGYNNQSTFKDVVSSQRSSTEWLGYDNDLRDRSHDNFAQANIAPGQFQQLSVLGLADYYKSLGVTTWIDNSAIGDIYFKLALVKMGLLPDALINDDVAFKNAKAQYNSGPYTRNAFNVINAEVPATGKSFANNWNTTTRQAPLNFTQSFSIGNQASLFGKPLGLLFGYRYGSSIIYDPASTAARVRADQTISSFENRQLSKETNGWSALMNVAYKFHPNHSVALMFMPNFTGVNNVAAAMDTIDPSNNHIYTKAQFYEQRKQLVYQYKSEHYVPSLKLKAELNASYTNGKSSAPDFKYVQYWYLPLSHEFEVDRSIGQGINRFYRYLSDNLFDSRLSLEIPFFEKPSLTRKLKFGGAYQQNDKKDDRYAYTVNFEGNSSLKNDDLNEFFNPDNFGIRTYTDANGQQQSAISQYYSEDASPANHTFGYSKISAAFLMLDYSINTRLRVSGGLRVEEADIFTDVFKFDSLQLAANDARRDYTIGLPAANPGKLNEKSYLPSMNVIYKLKADDASPVNLRLNYSQTIARPSIRELSDVAVFDYEYRTYVYGNSDLKSVRIKNYDLRIESYFKSGDNISLSLFYKDFRNHIELVKSNGISWQNVDKSYVEGIELEGKKRLTKHFAVKANITFVHSVSKFVRTRIDIGGNGTRNYVPLDTVSRTMFGQAPYVINGIVEYTADSLGLTATLSYNVQGPRLVIAADVKETPDIFEMPRSVLDLKITKSLSKHFNASLTIRDILNSEFQRKYKGWGAYYEKYHYGTNYVLGISYKL